MPVEIDTLAHLPLFEGLSSVDLEELCTHFEHGRLEAKTAIIKEGDRPGHPIYVLTGGSVDVVKSGADGRFHVISSLTAPSVFGELEVLARRPAIAGVIAATDVEVATLGRGVFDELCNAGRPCVLKVVKNIAQVLSYRLAATDERLATYFAMGQESENEKLSHVRSLLYSGWRRPD